MGNERQRECFHFQLGNAPTRCYIEKQRRKEHDVDWKPYITADPEIMHGAACFRGTRVPVSVVLDSPGMRRKWRRLSVTQTASAAIAWAAIIGSVRPMFSWPASSLSSASMMQVSSRYLTA